MNYRPVNRVHPTVESAPTDKDKADADQKQQGGALLTSNKHPEVKPASGQESGEQKKRDAYDWISLGVGVLGLLGLWYYAYWAKVQAGANVRAVDASNINAKAAKTSADAAQTANQLAQQSLLISESPEIYVTKATLNGAPQIGKKVSASITYMNRGKLGAEQFGIGGILMFAETPPLRVRIGAIVNSTTVPPDVPYTLTFYSGSPITREQENVILAGTQTLFVIGYYRWINPLVSNSSRITIFCDSYVPKAGLGLTGCSGGPIVPEFTDRQNTK